MSEKKKILLIDNSLYTTGSIHSILQTTEQLKHNYTFIYVLPSKSVIFPLVAGKGFKVLDLPMLEISRSWKVLIYLPVLFVNTFRLIRIIKREGIDVVHINDIYNMLGVMIRLFYPKMKVIYYVRLLHTSYIAPMYPIFAALIRKFAETIICVSSAVQKDMGNPEQSLVIYTTFVSESLSPWDGLKTPAALRILYLGNYIFGKGHQWALYALADVVKKFPGTKITFVGGCNHRMDYIFKQELANLATKLNITPNTEFKEATTEVEKLIKSSDVVLNLSESESFSMICLEAISYGVPLVASNCGGPAEITEDGTKAFLVPNKDYKAASNALIEIIKHPETARLKAIEAKAYSKEKFNPEVAMRKLKTVYG